MSSPTERIEAITKRQQQRRAKKVRRPRKKQGQPHLKRELVMVVTLGPDTSTRDDLPYILLAISMVRGVVSVDIQSR